MCICTHVPYVTHMALLQPQCNGEPALSSPRVGKHPSASLHRGCGNMQGFILGLLRWMCLFARVPIHFLVVYSKDDLAEQLLGG